MTLDDVRNQSRLTIESLADASDPNALRIQPGDLLASTGHSRNVWQVIGLRMREGEPDAVYDGTRYQSGFIPPVTMECLSGEDVSNVHRVYPAEIRRVIVNGRAIYGKA